MTGFKTRDAEDTKVMLASDEAKKHDRKGYFTYLMRFGWICVAFAAILYSITTDRFSVFMCDVLHEQEEAASPTVVNCDKSFIPLIIAIILGLTSLMPYMTMVFHCFIRLVDICGLFWLMFLMEKYQQLMPQESVFGYIGYAIISGIVMQQIAEPVKGKRTDQAIFTAMVLATAVIALTCTYGFSKYWSFDIRRYLITICMLLQSTVSLTAMSCWAENRRKSQTKDLFCNPLVRCVGLCILLLVIIPSSTTDDYAVQFAIVTAAVFVYVCETWCGFYTHCTGINKPTITEV